MKDLQPTAQDLLFEDRRKKTREMFQERCQILSPCGLQIPQGCEKKHLQPNLKYNSGICLVRPKKTHKEITQKLITRARFEPRISLVSNHTTQT